MTIAAARSPAPPRVVVSGALALLPEIARLTAGGAEVVAADRDLPALLAATGTMGGLSCLSVDPDLTLDARRLSSAIRRLGGCEVFVHHLGGGDGSAPAFLGAMRLLHTVRPQMARGCDGLIALTGATGACARSLAIVLDRAGTFRAGTGPQIVQCDPRDLPGLLDEAVARMRPAAALPLAG